VDFPLDFINDDSIDLLGDGLGDLINDDALDFAFGGDWDLIDDGLGADVNDSSWSSDSDFSWDVHKLAGGDWFEDSLGASDEFGVEVSTESG